MLEINDCRNIQCVCYKLLFIKGLKLNKKKKKKSKRHNLEGKRWKMGEMGESGMVGWVGRPEYTLTEDGLNNKEIRIFRISGDKKWKHWHRVLEESFKQRWHYLRRHYSVYICMFTTVCKQVLRARCCSHYCLLVNHEYWIKQEQKETGGQRYGFFVGWWSESRGGFRRRVSRRTRHQLTGNRWLQIMVIFAM